MGKARQWDSESRASDWLVQVGLDRKLITKQCKAPWPANPLFSISPAPFPRFPCTPTAHTTSTKHPIALLYLIMNHIFQPSPTGACSSVGRARAVPSINFSIGAHCSYTLTQNPAAAQLRRSRKDTWLRGDNPTIIPLGAGRTARRSRLKAETRYFMIDRGDKYDLKPVLIHVLNLSSTLTRYLPIW